jgi:exopolysaccharide biosynthesis polyprenyl glycosylphosphotransferase
MFSIHFSKWKLLLLLGDIGVLMASVLLGLIFSAKIPHPWLFFIKYWLQFMLIGVTYLLVLYISDIYDYYQDFRIGANIIWVLSSAVVGTLVSIIIFYFPLGAFVGRLFLVWQGAAFALLLALWRYAFSAIALPMRLKTPVLIMGAGKAGRCMLDAIRQRPNSGYQVLGFLDDDPRKVGSIIDDLPVLGQSKDLHDLVQREKIAQVIIAITNDKAPGLLDSLARLTLTNCRVIDMPTVYEILTGKIPIDHISDIWLFFNSLNNSRLYYRKIKRLTDLVFALLVLLVSWPLLVLAAIAIKLDSSGPIFYRQERLGKDGEPFYIIKFRTMIPNAEQAGPQWAAPNDSRVTRVGRVLRKMRLDEFPQLINILKGEMSLIGPRPERQEFVQEFRAPVAVWQSKCSACPLSNGEKMLTYKERLPYYSYRLLSRPGLTGWAQVKFPYASTMEETKEKLQYDLYYIKHVSFFLDLAILLKTLRIVLFGHGR